MTRDNALAAVGARRARGELPQCDPRLASASPPSFAHRCASSIVRFRAPARRAGHGENGIEEAAAAARDGGKVDAAATFAAQSASAAMSVAWNNAAPNAASARWPDASPARSGRARSRTDTVQRASQTRRRIVREPFEQHRGLTLERHAPAHAQNPARHRTSAPCCSFPAHARRARAALPPLPPPLRHQSDARSRCRTAACQGRGHAHGSRAARSPPAGAAARAGRALAARAFEYSNSPPTRTVRAEPNAVEREAEHRAPARCSATTDAMCACGAARQMRHVPLLREPHGKRVLKKSDEVVHDERRVHFEDRHQVLDRFHPARAGRCVVEFPMCGERRLVATRDADAFLK